MTGEGSRKRLARNTSTGDHENAEQQALTVSMVGTLFMGVAGVVAAILSNSQAILLDGLLSFVGFIAALFARRVGVNIRRKPDLARPLGYGADESIFATFRALSLLGIVLFAITNSILSIGAYIAGQQPAPLNIVPVAIYVGIILIVCCALWTVHRRAWNRTGRQSEILKLEANAAAFDGAITAAAALGLCFFALLGDSPIAPIGDSIIVLVLCSIASIRYFNDFNSGLAELAGATAPAEKYSIVRRALREPLDAWCGHLIETAVLKTGRNYSVAIFVDPGRPVTPDAVDALTAELEDLLLAKLGQTSVVIVITSRGFRRRPARPD